MSTQGRKEKPAKQEHTGDRQGEGKCGSPGGTQVPNVTLCLPTLTSRFCETQFNLVHFGHNSEFL